MGFPRQEYWSGLQCPPLEDLPDPGTELASPALAGGFFTVEPPGEADENIQRVLNVSYYYYLTLQVRSDLLSSLNLFVGFSCVT